MITKLSAETLKKVFSSEIKMAALNQERCTLATDDTIKNCEILQKNTSKSTSFWLSVWKTWYEGKSIALEIEEHEPAELNRLLEKF